MKIIHEMDQHGNHRLVCENDDGSIHSEGAWSGYRGIAEVKLDGESIMATTQYYEGSLPCEVPFKLVTLSHMSDKRNVSQ